MATKKNEQNHLFKDFKKNKTLKMSVLRQREALTGFKHMLSSIIKSTPINLTEQTIQEGHAFMENYARDNKYGTLMDENDLVCNMLTENIDPKVSCYPNEVILEIRKAYNDQNPDTLITNADEDISGILSALKEKVGKNTGTEDTYLTVFPKIQEMQYRFKYFAPVKYLIPNSLTSDTPFRDENKSTDIYQFHDLFRQFEKKYQDCVFIHYVLRTDDVFKFYNTLDKFNLYYNNEYTESFKDEYEKITHDDTAMFTIHNTFTHIYLIILLQYFLKREEITQICIMLSYSRHAQAIYINKTGPGHFFFYNSNGDNSSDLLHSSIKNDVYDLLKLTYSTVIYYTNQQQQYRLPLCAAFAIKFIKSMLDTTLSLSDKLTNAQRKENLDHEIEKAQFQILNKNIPKIRLKPDLVQQITDNTDTIKRLHEKSGLLTEFIQYEQDAEYFVVCDDPKMHGMYVYVGADHPNKTLYFYDRIYPYSIKYDTAKFTCYRNPVLDYTNTAVPDDKLVKDKNYYVYNVDDSMKYTFVAILRFLRMEGNTKIFYSNRSTDHVRFDNAIFYEYLTPKPPQLKPDTKHNRPFNIKSQQPLYEPLPLDDDPPLPQHPQQQQQQQQQPLPRRKTPLPQPLPQPQSTRKKSRNH